MALPVRRRDRRLLPLVDVGDHAPVFAAEADAIARDGFA